MSTIGELGSFLARETAAAGRAPEPAPAGGPAPALTPHVPSTNGAAVPELPTGAST